MITLDRVIRGIEASAHDALRENFRPDCCIAATRCVMRVLKRFHFQSAARTVQLFIFNPAYVKATLAGDVPPVSGRGTPQFAAWLARTGAYSVGCGLVDELKPGPRQCFEGHLVVTVGNKWLIDASVRQAERREHGILLPKVMVVENFSRFPIELDCENGAQLLYREVAIGNRYRESPDWVQKHRTKRAMKRIIEHIEKG